MIFRFEAFAWKFSLGNSHLGDVAWKASLGIPRLGTFVWVFAWNLRLELQLATFTWEPSLRNPNLGKVAQGLGFEIFHLGIVSFGLGRLGGPTPNTYSFRKQ